MYYFPQIVRTIIELFEVLESALLTFLSFFLLQTVRALGKMRFNKSEVAALALGQPSHKFEKEGVLFVREKQEGFFRRNESKSINKCLNFFLLFSLFIPLGTFLQTYENRIAFDFKWELCNYCSRMNVYWHDMTVYRPGQPDWEYMMSLIFYVKFLLVIW